MIYSKVNYILLAACVVLVLLGYVLMSGGEGTAELFSFRRISLAPVVVILGFGLGGFAIMWRPNSPDEANTNSH